MHEFSCNKIQLDTSPSRFGELRRSNDILDEPKLLKQRLDTEGYLYLNGFFDSQQIREIRQTILENLSSEGVLDGNHAVEEARLKPDIQLNSVHPELCKLPSIKNLIYGGKLQNFFSTLLGGPAKPFDNVWTRTIKPWLAETPHCDIVYMGRGTKQLYTTWIPIGDVPRKHGGLMVLERSHQTEKLNKYRSIDVDKDNNWKKLRFRHGKFFRGVHYSKNANKVQQEFGLRWLTTDYTTGDIMIFHTDLLHGTLDNTFDRIRLSIDTRFQLASEPMDQRFVGDNPIGHNLAKPVKILKIFKKFIAKPVNNP